MDGLLKNNDANSVEFILNKLILAICFSATLFLLCWVLYFCHYGIDFTDESFYLVWASNPFIYPSSTTQFGFVYHPIFRLVGNDISLFRQVNIVFTFCLAWIFGYVFLREVFRKHSLGVLFCLVISSSFATSSLLFIQLGIRVPSYNSLNLQALLITSIGVLLIERGINAKSIAGAVLIGFGGWLEFMAKPPSALALGLIVCVYLLLVRKFQFKLILLAILCATLLLFISAVVIDGSLLNFISRIQNGTVAIQAMGGGHSFAAMLRIDKIGLAARDWLLLAFEVGFFFGITVISQCRANFNRTGYVMLLILACLFTLQVILATTGSLLHYNSHRASFIFSIPVVTVLVAIVFSNLKTIANIPREQWALVILFALLPAAYAFGTNNNYWQSGGNAGVFWIFSSLIFLFTIKSAIRLRNLLLLLGAMAQLVVIANIQAGFEMPYRQPQPLSKNDKSVSVGGSELILSKSFADYLSAITIVAEQAGFKKQTPIIDLTGRSPGVLYALGAINTGSAWMLGGYPGSVDLAKIRLKQVSCDELVIAWVLYEPNGPRRITSDLLMSFGANIEEDYSLIGLFTTPIGAGYHESYTQIFFKPNRDKISAIYTCEQIREMAK